jgi:hypothetical protein
MRHKPDELAERVAELEKQFRQHDAETARRLVALENSVAFLAEEASEEQRRKLGRLGFVRPGKGVLRASQGRMSPESPEWKHLQEQVHGA